MSGQSNGKVRLARPRRRGSAPSCPKTFPHSFGLRPGVDLDKLGQLSDELEAEAFADKVYDFCPTTPRAYRRLLRMSQALR